MKRTFALALTLMIILNSGCSLFRGGTAKQNAVQALVTTTRSAILIMTAAGIAYDAGAFGQPGSARAEETWSRISAESIRLHTALTAWQTAIEENKDATPYASGVAQALAVIGALLPSSTHSDLGVPYVPPTFDAPAAIARFADPSSFAFAGGAR